MIDGRPVFVHGLNSGGVVSALESLKILSESKMEKPNISDLIETKIFTDPAKGFFPDSFPISFPNKKQGVRKHHDKHRY
jgi:hypothetical protein